MKRIQFIACLFLFTSFCSFLGYAQKANEMQHIRQNRYSMIHCHHIGLGIETNMFENCRISPRLYYSFGSFRHIVSVSSGVKYVYEHPLMHISDEKITSHYLGPFIGADINFGRWESGCVYAGAEYAYLFTLMGNHYLPSEYIVQDPSVGNHHSYLRAKLGVRLERFDINIHCEYDFAPAFNQKYIYESTEYNYDILKPSLFERWRIGLYIAYLIPL